MGCTDYGVITFEIEKILKNELCPGDILIKRKNDKDFVFTIFDEKCFDNGHDIFIVLENKSILGILEETKSKGKEEKVFDIDSFLKYYGSPLINRIVRRNSFVKPYIVMDRAKYIINYKGHKYYYGSYRNFCDYFLKYKKYDTLYINLEAIFLVIIFMIIVLIIQISIEKIFGKKINH